MKPLAGRDIGPTGSAIVHADVRPGIVETMRYSQQEDSACAHAGYPDAWLEHTDAAASAARDT